MYHLLVVDDEITSRNGLIRNISTMNLNFTRTETADDGVHAMELVSYFRPDIVLTDVRMPRMDGIEMSYKLRELYPDIIIIFMSGYSDKEYLKSAIHLKAVNYVEKPVDYTELRKSLQLALDMLQEKRQNSVIHKDYQKMVSNLSLLGNELALSLTSSYRQKENHFDYSLLGISEEAYFVTILIRLFPAQNRSVQSLFPIWERISEQTRSFLETQKLQGIFAIKDDCYFVLHIASLREPEKLINRDFITLFLTSLPPFMENCRFCIAVGSRVHGIDHIYFPPFCERHRWGYETLSCFSLFNLSSF